MKLALLISLALVACNPVVSPVADPTDRNDSGDASDGAAKGTCSTACGHLRTLGCALGKPTPRGGTCEASCANAFNEGAVDWPTTCLLRASSCAVADACK